MRRILGQTQIRISLVAICILALSLSLSSTPRKPSSPDSPTPSDTTSDPGQINKLGPILEALLEAGGRRQEELPVVIHFSEEVKQAEDITQDERTWIIEGAGGRVRRHYRHLKSSLSGLTRSEVKAIASHPQVKRLTYDHKVKSTLATTARAIGADQVWAGLTGLPRFTGSGVGIALIDSGISGTSDVTSDISTHQSFDLNNVYDFYGHGTHVAGILTSDGILSDEGSGFPEQYRGIAPDSHVISLRVLDDAGSGYTSSVIAALDWCIENKNIYNIRVINLSLGHPVCESYKTDPLCQMVEKCVTNGIVVVVAAGNHGKAEDGSVIYGGITSPGNSPFAITVGAINTHETIAVAMTRLPVTVQGGLQQLTD